MDLASEGTRASRRRGAELEEALLDAAWQQLLVAGYGGFTFDAVAERAHTSKPVLYRRWPTREDLLLALIRHQGKVDVFPVPNTGSLRGDMISLLTTANETRSGMMALLSAQLGTYFQATGLTPADLRREFLGGRPSTMTDIMRRAIERGEVDPARLTPRVVSLAFDLFRHEALMTFRPVPAETIRQIVDDVYLPLVRPAGAEPRG